MPPLNSSLLPRSYLSGRRAFSIIIISGSDLVSARSVATSSMKSVPSSIASSQSWAKSGSFARQARKFRGSQPAARAAADTESPTANRSRKILRTLKVLTKRDMGSCTQDDYRLQYAAFPDIGNVTWHGHQNPIGTIKRKRRISLALKTRTITIPTFQTGNTQTITQALPAFRILCHEYLCCE